MLSPLDRYTSTGEKFWSHPQQMRNYREGTPNTVISAHISPEGACNLDCSYCPVHKRAQSQRMSLQDMLEYAAVLKRHGLQAVILTGGGAAPGLNAVLRAFVKAATELGLEVYGSEDGFAALIEEPARVVTLTRASVRGMLPRGGMARPMLSLGIAFVPWCHSLSD